MRRKPDVESVIDVPAAFDADRESMRIAIRRTPLTFNVDSVDVNRLPMTIWAPVIFEASMRFLISSTGCCPSASICTTA